MRALLSKSSDGVWVMGRARWDGAESGGKGDKGRIMIERGLAADGRRHDHWAPQSSPGRPRGGEWESCARVQPSRDGRVPKSGRGVWLERAHRRRDITLGGGTGRQAGNKQQATGGGGDRPNRSSQN